MKMSDNHDEPMSAEDTNETSGVARPESIPGTVIVALVMVTVILVGFLVGTALLSEGMGRDLPAPVIALVVTLGVLGGTVMRYSFAWTVSRQLASIMSVFAVLGIVRTLFSAYAPDTLWRMLVLGGILALNTGIIWMMSTRSARAWFGLVCPECGDRHSRPARFGSRTSFCGNCGTLWESRTGTIRKG